MTDPMIADLRRELEKARDALENCRTYLARHAEGNAALHCADRVMYSPLHAKVDAVMAGIEHALARTTPDPSLSTLDYGSGDGAWAALVADLDRCEHGRHSADSCFGCPGGQSAGNLLLPVGKVIGTGLRDVIRVPEEPDRHNPKAWRVRADAPPAEPTP